MKFEFDHPASGQMQVRQVKIGDFRPIFRYISETVQDRDVVKVKSKVNLIYIALYYELLISKALRYGTC